MKGPWATLLTPATTAIIKSIFGLIRKHLDSVVEKIFSSLKFINVAYCKDTESFYLFIFVYLSEK